MKGWKCKRQSAEICHFYEKEIILLHIMDKTPLQGHSCDSVLVISSLLIKIGELESLGTWFLWIKHAYVNQLAVTLPLQHFIVL